MEITKHGLCAKKKKKKLVERACAEAALRCSNRAKTKKYVKRRVNFEISNLIT